MVFDELLRWDPDAKRQSSATNRRGGDGDDDDEDGAVDRNAVGQWTRILTPPPHPPPRCAHSAVYHNDAIYVFGGESAASERYHHYRDLWKFDVRANTWEECRSAGGPHARSGHRCLVWRHSMILFGGFHESAKNNDIRFFNDVHMYDFQAMSWTELKHGKLARLPPPRSACNLALMSSPSGGGEALFVYGGYSKVRNASNVHACGGGQQQQQQQQHRTSGSEGIVHVDCWMLPLKSLLSDGGIASSTPPTWERITRKGEYPSGRAGSSSVVYQKNRMVVFGGVMDDEGDHHAMVSTFYDDLFAFDMERRRWFAMGLKEKKKIAGGGGGGGGGGRRRRKKDAVVDAGAGRAMAGAGGIDDGDDDGDIDDFEEDDDAPAVAKNEEVKSSGWGLDKLRHDMFAFKDGDGNVVFEKIDGATRDDEEEGMTSATQSADQLSETAAVSRNFNDLTLGDADRVPALKGIGKRASSSVMKVDHKGHPAAVARETPLPRINCASVVRNNTLYIYGGLLEVGDREVS